MMQNKITVYVKSVFGVKKYYPRCEITEKLSDMLRQKSFTPDNISYFEKLGYKIEYLGDSEEAKNE